VITASWLLAAGVVAVAYVPRPWQIGAVFAVVLVLVGPLNTVFDTYEMKIIPDKLYGRVSALVNFLCSALMWIGPIVAGLLADVFSPVTAVALLGAVLGLLAVWVQVAKALYQLDEGRTESSR
jgi:MFS family permease